MSIIHNVIHVLPANNSVRQKLNGIIGDGIMQTDLWIITRTVIAPVIMTALLAITIPGITSWGILQMLGKGTKETRRKRKIFFSNFFFNLCRLKRPFTSNYCHKIYLSYHLLYLYRYPVHLYL